MLNSQLGYSQSIIKLTWEPSVSSNITKYLFYRSTNNSFFEVVTNALPNPPFEVNVPVIQKTANYYFATAVDTKSESQPSNIIQYFPIVTNTPMLGLDFEAEFGDITSPFYITNGLVQQDIQTISTDGGRASYLFSITNSGDYNVKVVVNAPDEASNSLYVKIDGEPDENFIWDIPITIGNESRTVRLRNTTNDTIYTLTAGFHSLIFRGREPIKFDKISIVPLIIVKPIAPPTNLRVALITGRRFDLQWKSVTNLATEVEQSIKAEPFNRITTTQPGVMHYTLQLDKKREYSFRVRSIDFPRTSDYSNIATTR